MHHILTLNSGSSSIKFALFAVNGAPVEKVRGQVEGLGGVRAPEGGDRTLPYWSTRCSTKPGSTTMRAVLPPCWAF